MTTYVPATAAVQDRLRYLIDQFHPDLDTAGVTLVVLMAHAPTDAAGEPLRAALKHRGVRVAACVRVVNLKDRAKGVADAEILLDGDRWPDWPRETQIAILDHELTHLVAVAELKDEEGRLQTAELDACDRPKLRLRPHDWEFGWYDSVAERHGDASLEVIQASALIAAKGQLYLPGFDAATGEVRETKRGAA